MALSLSLLLVARPAFADAAIPEEAKLYFKNGVELIQSQPPNYQDAYYQFKLAWEKSKSWKVLSNWGLCALKLERDGEAIWAYTEYLKQKDIDPEERKDLERDLLLLNGNASSVTISSDVADLELVDARAGSSAPPQTYRLDGGQLALRLRAGSHAITATSQGKTLRWDITLSPGTVQEHRFEFAAAAAAPPPAPAAARPPQVALPPPSASTPQQRDVAPTSGGTVRKVGYVVAGVGVVAAGGGLLLGSLAKGTEADARDRCEDRPLTGFTCPDSLRSDFEDAENKALMANVMMIAGGALAAGGVVMILVGGPKAKPASARLELSPLVGWRQGGLVAQGSF